MARINEKFGELVPDVFIGNIKIVKSYNSIQERKNARVDSNFADPGTDNRYKNDLKGRISSKSGGQLKATVRLYLKEVVGNDFKTFWFRQGGIYEFLKIRIVQSLSSGVTRDIVKNFTEILPGGHLETVANQQSEGAASSLSYKDIKVNSLLQPLFKYKTITANNSSIYDVPFEITFNVIGDDPQHLAYHAICYIDSHSSDGRKVRNKLQARSSGRPSSELIIDSGKLQHITGYYTNETTGRLHLGPMYSSEGRLYSGTSPGIGRNQLLKSNMIPNIKVKDYRIIDEFEKIPLDFKNSDTDPVRPNKTLALKSKIQYNKKNDDVFFTNLFLSHRNDGSAVFSFGLDINKVFENYSYHNKIMKNPDKSIASSFIDNSYIRKIKVIRRRVEDELTGVDRFGFKALKEFRGPDGSCDDHVVVETKSHRLREIISRKMKATHTEADTLETIGAIKVSNVSVDNATNLVYFKCFDKQLSKVTDGIYQYGVEIDIEDNTRSKLVSTYRSLESARYKYERYCSLARMMGYNHYNKKYSTGFMNVAKQYSAEEGIESPWLALLKEFNSAINLFMGHRGEIDAIFMSKFMRLLYSLSCPISSDSSEPFIVLSLVDKFLRRIADILGIETNRQQVYRKKTSGLYTKTVGETSPLPVFKLEKYFGASLSGKSNTNLSSELVDAAARKDFGYEYISNTIRPRPRQARTAAGQTAEVVVDDDFQSYSVEEINDRFETETFRYFNKPSPNVDIRVGNKVYTNRDFVGANRHRFLAPSAVGLGRDREVNLVREEENLFNDEKNVSVFLDVLNHNFHREAKQRDTTDPRSSRRQQVRDLSRDSSSSKLEEYLSHRDVRITSESKLAEERERDEDVEKEGRLVPANEYLVKTAKVLVNSDECSDDDELVQAINDTILEKKSVGREIGTNISRLRTGKKITVGREQSGRNLGLSLLGAEHMDILSPQKDLQLWDLERPDNVVSLLREVKSERTSRREAAGEVLDLGPRVDRRRPGSADIPVEKQNMIRELPMQIKSLLHSGLNGNRKPGRQAGRNVTKYDFKSVGRKLAKRGTGETQGKRRYDPLQDVNKASTFWMMHGQLAELQVYTGQKTTNDRKVNMKEPDWRPMDENTWRQVQEGGETMCRLVRYKNEKLFGKSPKMFDMPINNELFVIKGKGKKRSRPDTVAPRVAGPIDTMLSKMEKYFTETIYQEYTTTLVVPSQRFADGKRRARPRPPLPNEVREENVNQRQKDRNVARKASPKETKNVIGVTDTKKKKKKGGRKTPGIRGKKVIGVTDNKTPGGGYR